MPRRELLILRILLFRLFSSLLLGVLIRLVFIFLKVVDCKFHDCEETRLFIVTITFAKLLPRFFEIGGQVTQDVSKTDKNGRTFLVLHHRLEITLDVATFDNFLCAAVIQRHFGEKACNVEAKFFSLTKGWVEENVTKLANCTRC